MDHRLIRGIEQALGLSEANGLGRGFIRGALTNPDLCTRILTPARLLDLVMRRSVLPPQLRCFQNGSELHPNSYLSLPTTRRGQAVPMVNMNRLGNLIRSGCTLVLDALNQFDPTMEIACRALQWWSHELVQVNVYLTTQDTAGFALHWDDHDVIIVQLAGDKDWEIRGSSRIAPMYRDTAPNLEPSDQIVWSGTLQTGDIMYIPRGHWHQATRCGKGKGFSLHVTFGFAKRTGVDWLSWLADRSREEELFRGDLDRWGSQERHQDQTRALTKAASRLLTSLPPSNFLIAREQEHSTSRHVTTWGVFDPITIVVCVTEFKPVFETDDDIVVLRAAGKKITFRVEALPALEILLSGLPADLNYVSSTTGIDAVRLADVLLQEGICAEVTPELFSGYTGLAMHENFSNPR